VETIRVYTTVDPDQGVKRSEEYMDGSTRPTASPTETPERSSSVPSITYTEEGVARMTAWLKNLPPDLAKFYDDLKRMDPKGQPRR
jgi:hypothetical protein